ncbi:hypothetical protein V2J09_018640 [Rumex salicifolius]
MIKRKLNLGGIRTSRGDQAATATTSFGNTTPVAVRDEDVEWEMRPGGMLVQKRTDIAADNPTPLIRVRVVFESARFEISVNSQATFVNGFMERRGGTGEVKKALTAECGLEHWEQRLLFRGKEREDKDFLDISGVKDRSKVVLIEDPCSREKRMVEMRRSGKIQRAQRAVTDVAAEVDQLAEQVTTMKKSIAKGVKVPEIQITTIIEMLMRQAVKLDAISTHAEISALKTLQGKRVQKCVETLDALKVANAKMPPVAVVTTKWETFDPPTPPQWNLLD